MTLLIDEDYSNRARELSTKSSTEIVIFSAFIKQGALDWLLEVVNQNVQVQVIARWQKNDILYGASDLSVYQMCKKRDWEFGICQRLHSKLFLFDSKHILLGSANLTNRGLSLNSLGNIEIGVEVAAAGVDLTKLISLRNEVTWVNDELFNKIRKEAESTKIDTHVEVVRNWSSSVQALLDKPIEYLWVSELSFAIPEKLLRLNLDEESSAHDYQLLELNFDEIGEDSLKYKFKRSRLYHWFCSQLQINGEMNFGALSAALHNSLLDDPRPYRREVKEFVAVLFSWAEFLSDEFEITKHNVTSSVKLSENTGEQSLASNPSAY